MLRSITVAAAVLFTGQAVSAGQFPGTVVSFYIDFNAQSEATAIPQVPSGGFIMTDAVF